jgi:hypothetical protein
VRLISEEGYGNVFGGIDPNSSLANEFLYHDNAPANGALIVREFMAEKSSTKMIHPSYSSDLAPLTL